MGLVSTVPDMAKLTADLLRPQPTVLSTTSVEELFTPDYVCHSSHLPPDLPSGREGMQRFVTEFLSGYPQLRFTVEEQTTEGEEVRSQIVARSAFPIGAVMSIPTDPSKVANAETITGTSRDRFVGNKIAESWIDFQLPNPFPQAEEMPN